MAAGELSDGADSSPLRVILIGNYANDGQESMQRFARTLERELPAHGVAVEFLRPKPLIGRLLRSGAGIGKWLGYLDKFVIFPFVLRLKLVRWNAKESRTKPHENGTAPCHTLVHICDHSNAMYAHHLQRVPNLVTCNDLLAVRSALGEFPENRTKWSGRLLQRWILSGMKRAQQITCISEATRRDVIRLIERPATEVTVTYMGQNYTYSPMPRHEAIHVMTSLLGSEVRGLDRSPVRGERTEHFAASETEADISSRSKGSLLPFILHVGGDQWYKNRSGVLQIYAAVCRKLRAAQLKAPNLIMVGPRLSSDQETFLQREHLADAVRILQGVSNEGLRALYSAAELLLFPSLEEGFGWPIAEAQACGCRVVTTGKAPMTEVGGEAAAYFQPDDLTRANPEPVADIVFKVLQESEGARTARIEGGIGRSGYLLDQENGGRIRRDLSERGQIFPRLRALRILHSIHSMDSTGGGVVEAIRQMATVHQAAGHTVEVLSLDPPSEEQAAESFPGRVHALGRRRLSYGYSELVTLWLRPNADRFDAVIVNGLWQYSSYGVWRGLRGTNIPYFVVPHGMLDPWFKRAYPLKHLKKQLYWALFERQVLRDARSVIFTSEEERTAARTSFWPYTCREAVAPLGISGPAGDPDKQRRQFLEAFPKLQNGRVLLFLGRIHEKKGLDLLLRAFAKISAGALASLGESEPLHLVIAGPCDDPAYLSHLQKLASDSFCNREGCNVNGGASPLTWIPMLRGDLKWGAFHAADAFVLPSHQENFGIAVAEALACGVPVLISDKVNIWREIEQDGAGYVETDTVEGTERLLKQWVKMNDNGEAGRAKMSACARQCFETRFEATHAAQRFIEVLAEGICR